MRIPRPTHTAMTKLLNTQGARLSNEVHKLETQAVTGLKISKPSDAPLETGAALRLNNIIDNQDVYKRNADYATSILGVADEALGQVTDVFKRAREIAVQGASEQFNASNRTSMAREIEVLRARLVDLSNTRLGERYVFSGTEYNTASFDNAGTYGGSTDLVETLVGDDQWVDVGFDGSDVFQGTVDAFAVLEDLENALNANDPVTTFNLLGDLDDAAEQAIDWREIVGHNYKSTDDASAVASSLSAVMQIELGDIVNADPIETYTRLNELRQNYQSAMQVGASSTSATLFGFLR